MDKKEKAKKMFHDLPRGLILPSVQILILQNKMNKRLGYTGDKCKHLDRPSDFDTLTDEELDAVIEIIPVLAMDQVQPPSPDEIIKLL